jgi:hypothetical protein
MDLGIVRFNIETVVRQITIVMDSMNSPKDNKIERLEAELNETKMQSLADLGQAQEALEAKEKAETRSAAERMS